MTPSPTPIRFAAADGTDLAAAGGTVVVFAAGDGTLLPQAAALDGPMGGALSRAVGDEGWKGEAGKAIAIEWPAGIAARRVVLACLGADPSRADARKTGGAIGRSLGKGEAVIGLTGAGSETLLAEMLWAAVLRLYSFRHYKTGEDDTKAPHALVAASEDAGALEGAWAPFAALAEGVFFTRDLVNEPANTLTTAEFAKRLADMAELGLEVEVLGEPELEAMGARALLAVGQGSVSESKIVVMKWMGGAEGEAPLALVGKGVVFDTGGISIKPSAGMEEMTMDMGGAGVVSGVMRTLALRKAKANVIGLVGLVENMPDGNAQRPGDIVQSMKGDMIEVINTDAEGRLVLADVLWHCQQKYKPSCIIDLATLTGAVIIALGHHNAGYFSNDEAFAEEFRGAADVVGDKAWRLPLGKPYAKQIESRLADVANTGGRSAGSITAAEFLHRFIEKDMPWIHIDIAGVTLATSPGDLWPKGATGWGVAALDEFVRRREG